MSERNDFVGVPMQEQPRHPNVWCATEVIQTIPHESRASQPRIPLSADGWGGDPGSLGDQGFRGHFGSEVCGDISAKRVAPNQDPARLYTFHQVQVVPTRARIGVQAVFS
jgi:hypothetical protein